MIHQVLTSALNSNSCSTVYIYHPVMSITMKHLHTLQHLIHKEQHQKLSNQTLYHHLRITASSPLIPRDRSLHVTIDNNTYALTFPCATTMDTRYRLHLFLNPYNCMSYLRHTHEIDKRKTRHLEITTNISSTRSPSTRAQRRPIMHTTPHTPNLLTTLTFSAESLQHQLSILTLATHMILSVSILT